ncbi:PP2C family serine/threonine-protein phosphatase [Demequina sp. NBRC 110054]|uniref:PP2C family protein-serine/threonine phosphatase n=1 Tax=Demequina sp. NBRC 110054 TaxID=1570343 RepID=UPI0009FE6876|nr:protein phosphatase 2C domain-containing protein [Demequina sp. NBRC 110054]
MTILTLGTVTLSVGAATDPGMVRPQNEDAYLADGPAFVVADGMGGYEAGDQASAAVVEAFKDLVPGPDYGTYAQVEGALREASTRVAAVASATTVGAGSTATGAILTEHEGHPTWLVFNVGDSRVYRHSGTQLAQVTVDHSLGRELVTAGEMREEDLASFAHKNVITRAIGATDSAADAWLVPAVNGERLMLCSDGLYGEVADETIRAVLTLSGRPGEAARRLVSLANESGGRDNITVVVVDVLSGADPVQATSTDDVASDTLRRRR